MNGTATNYYLEGGNISWQADGTNTIHYTYDSDGDLAYMNLNGNLYYYERNAQNDIIGLVDSNMNEVVTYTYDSWGKLLNIGGSLAGTVGKINPFRYRGYYYDTETGLYYLSSRYYDPGVGRFINADGQVTTGSDLTGMNQFAYCGNNPVSRADPSGDSWSGFFCGFVCELICSKCSSKQKTGKSNKSTSKVPSSSSHKTSSSTAPPTPELKLYAATIYAEAGGENKKSKQAVAHVIKNRASSKNSTVTAIISKKRQFNGYNNSMYKEAMSYYDTGVYRDSVSKASLDECMSVVIPIYSGAEADITNGALYYYSPKNMNPPGRKWKYADSYTEVFINGVDPKDFRFYK